MDCSVVANELVAYHLDMCDSAMQEQLETHLVACPACVRSYLLLKRSLGNRPALARPRAEVKARLRAEVQEMYGTAKPRGVVRLARRPIPLYQGLGFALVAAALTLLVPKLVATQATHAAGPGPYVDNSRAVAENFTVY